MADPAPIFTGHTTERVRSQIIRSLFFHSFEQRLHELVGVEVDQVGRRLAETDELHRQTELGLPIKLVGLGETIGDMVPFDPTEFIDALFAE